MFKALEPDRRILFMDTQAQVVIGFDDFCKGSDRTIDIAFNDLATNEALLMALNLVSMYASGELRGKDYAVEFFVSYLSAFYGDEGVRERLETNPTLRILIQDEKLLGLVKQILK